MTAEQFLKQHLNYSERDLEYRPTTGYWKTLELMEEYHKEQLKLLNLPDVSKRSELLIAVERELLKRIHGNGLGISSFMTWIKGNL